MNKREKTGREGAFSIFAEHVAKLKVNTEDFSVIDWRNKNGSSAYYIQFIVDNKRGMLAISGDLGDCISCWYHDTTLKDIAHYVQNISYWMGKFCATSDDYTYKSDDIEADLKCIKEDYIFNKSEYTFAEKTNEEISKDFEELEIILDEQWTPGERLPTDAIDIIEKYNVDWWDGSDWTKIGRRISPMVYFWSEGLKMAYEQIKEELNEDR